MIKVFSFSFPEIQNFILSGNPSKFFLSDIPNLNSLMLGHSFFEFPRITLKSKGHFVLSVSDVFVESINALKFSLDLVENKIERVSVIKNDKSRVWERVSNSIRANEDCLAITTGYLYFRSGKGRLIHQKE